MTSSTYYKLFNGVQLLANATVTITDGIVAIKKGGVCAITLPDPPLDSNYATLTFIAQTAHAHTVTNTGSGFDAGGTSSDVATFGGAIGDGFEIVAIDGNWYVKYLRNVTLG